MIEKLRKLYKLDERFFPFFLATFLALNILFLFVLSITDNNSKSPEKSVKTSNKIQEIVQIKVKEPHLVEKWEILYNHEPTGISYVKDNIIFFNLDSQVKYWNGWLIGINQDYFVKRKYINENFKDESITNQISSIRVLNTNNGDLFDISLPKTQNGYYYLTSKVVDNIYFFGTGSRFSASFQYQLDLPPSINSRIQKIQTIVPLLEQYGPYHIDSACYEGCQYWFFNERSNKKTSLTRLNNAANSYDSSRTERFVGFDSYGHIILAKVSLSDSNKASESNFLLDYFFSVPINNESDETKLIDAKDLPEIPDNFYMINGINKILFHRDNYFIYDLDTNEVKYLSDINDKEIAINIQDPYSPYPNDKYICFRDADYNFIFALNIENETLLYEKDLCKKTTNSDPEQLFDDLNLNNNLTLYKSEVIYPITTYKKVYKDKIPEGAVIVD